MNFCILCRSVLNSSTKPEHILLKALGGKKTSRKILCSTCNAEMGNGPDNDLAESVRIVRNIGNFAAGDGRSAPPVHGLAAGGFTFDLLPAGRSRPKIEQHLKTSRAQTGETSIAIQAPTMQIFQQRAEDALKVLGVDEIKKELLRRQLFEGAEVISLPIPTLDFEMSFGGGESLRSVAKACMALWADHVGNEELLKPTYDDIREYVASNRVDHVGPSLLTIKMTDLPPAAMNFSRVPHFIWAGSNGNGEVRGYFHLYGIIGWSVLLCRSGAPPNSHIALFSDPEDPKRWSIGEECGSWISYSWVSTSESPFYPNLFNERMNFIRKIAYEKSRNTLFDEAYWSTLLEMGLQEDSPLDEVRFREFTDILARKVVLGMFKIPYKRKLMRRKGEGIDFLT